MQIGHSDTMQTQIANSFIKASLKFKGNLLTDSDSDLLAQIDPKKTAAEMNAK